MYYRTKQNDLTIERLKQNLSQSLKQSYQITSKKEVNLNSYNLSEERIV